MSDRFYRENSDFNRVYLKRAQNDGWSVMVGNAVMIGQDPETEAAFSNAADMISWLASRLDVSVEMMAPVEGSSGTFQSARAGEVGE